MYELYEVILQFLISILNILGYTESIRCPSHLGFIVHSLDKIKPILRSCFHNGAKHITLYVRTEIEAKLIHTLVKKYKDKCEVVYLPNLPKKIFTLHSKFQLHEINRVIHHY